MSTIRGQHMARSRLSSRDQSPESVRLMPLGIEKADRYASIPVTRPFRGGQLPPPLHPLRWSSSATGPRVDVRPIWPIGYGFERRSVASGCERKGDQGIAFHERELNAAQRRGR